MAYIEYARTPTPLRYTRFNAHKRGTLLVTSAVKCCKCPKSYGLSPDHCRVEGFSSSGGRVSSRWSSEHIFMVEWMMVSLRLLLIFYRDVLGEGMLDRSMTLP